MLFKFLADLECTQDRCFRSCSKYERCAITRRQPKQLAFSFSRAELRGAAHNPAQGLELFALLGNQQLRVADDVDEQDMADLEFYF